MDEQRSKSDGFESSGERGTPRGRHLAAVELASRSAAGFRRTARRYSLCADDAEDAYQRALEILLKKAPTDDLRQLRPWLHTVVKHEALAVRAQRERMLGREPADADSGTAPGPDERAPERERARQTAEALGHLKRSELQCLLLKALGYSYDEIAGRTGYSWTKVNRSLTEGRKHFFDRFNEISSGASCEQLAPALAVAAGGDVDNDESRRLLAHLRGCASCRASLREQRTQARSGAGALSPALLLPALRGSWWSRLHDSIAGALIDRAGLASSKLQQITEVATAHKATAVVASTAVLASGVAAERHAEPRHTRPARAQAVQVAGTSEAVERPVKDSQPTPDRSDPQPAEELEQRQSALDPPPAQARQSSEFAVGAEPASPTASAPVTAPDSDRPDDHREKEFSP